MIICSTDRQPLKLMMICNCMAMKIIIKKWITKLQYNYDIYARKIFMKNHFHLVRKFFIFALYFMFKSKANSILLLIIRHNRCLQCL